MSLAIKDYTKADGDSIPYTLSASIRSDCCSVRAIYRVSFEFGDLHFCNHHFNKHKETILTKSTAILDESEILFN